VSCDACHQRHVDVFAEVRRLRAEKALLQAALERTLKHSNAAAEVAHRVGTLRGDELTYVCSFLMEQSAILETTR
jgi:hypothetical protein